MFGINVNERSGERWFDLWRTGPEVEAQRNLFPERFLESPDMGLAGLLICNRT